MVTLRLEYNEPNKEKQMRSWKFLIVALFSMIVICASFTARPVASQSSATEAPAGFDEQTNGLTTQSVFLDDREVFVEQEFLEDGLGPVYNAQSCGECHQNPVAGANSQITELRAGRTVGSNFFEHPGGSLINDRAIDAAIQERVIDGNDVRALRLSLSTLGDGFIEALPDELLIGIAAGQPIVSNGKIAGQVIFVPVLEASNSLRVGRFGWKNQHASLVSFSADAYLNEMGITSPLQPTENSSNGRSVALFDTVADPEDDGADIEIFARFMRATKVPPRDTQLAATNDAKQGAATFTRIGCVICHIPTLITSPPGRVINGGKFVVPEALGNKVIHPFSDFLLHDIGTGDGIVQNGGNSTRNKVRTSPLWGLRTRSRMMHDGTALTFTDAINRHGGEAADTARAYQSLSTSQKNQVLTFLRSL
jgi:CxxC motif-containing protein (DUF1111 family)